MAVFYSDVLQFFVAGSELGTATTKASVKLVNTPLDVTAFLNNAEKQNPNVRTDAIEWAGFFDDADRSINGLLSGSIGTVGDVVSFAVGTGVGNRSYSAVVQWRSVGISARIKDMARVESVWGPDGTLTPSKHFGLPRTTTGNNSGGATGTIDDSAASTGTGTVFLHLTQYTNSPTALSLYLEHSTLGTVFVAKSAVWVPTATGATALSFTGTLERYIRWTIEATGTGTVTAWVGYRRP